MERYNEGYSALAKTEDDHLEPSDSIPLHVRNNNTAFEKPADASPSRSDTLPIHNESSNSTNKGRWWRRRRESLAETPKVLFDSNRPRALGHFFFYHAAPLAGAIALIYINTETLFYGSNDTLALSALQYVAKLHEILMQLSIITIATALIQKLLTRSSIPFGAALSGSQITNPVYVVSKQFLASLSSREFPLNSKLVYSISFILMSILAIVVGPSSAIAMQPRLVNFTIPDVPAGFGGSMQSWYPQRFLAQDTVSIATTNIANSSLLSGYQSINEWAYLRQIPPPRLDDNSTFPVVGLAGTSQPPVYPLEVATSIAININNSIAQLFDLTSTSTERTMYIQWAANSTFATIQHVPVGFALQQASITHNTKFLPQYIPNGAASDSISANMPQPVVSVYCEPNWITSHQNGQHSGPPDDRPIQFPTTFIAPYCDQANSVTGIQCPELSFEEMLHYNYPQVTNFTDIPRQQLWDKSQSSNQSQLIFLDDRTFTYPFEGTTLGAIVVEPKTCSDPGFPDDAYLLASACLIGATWTNMTALSGCPSLDKDGSCLNSSVVVTNSIDSKTMTSPQIWSGPLVQLTKAWADGLNQPTWIQNRTIIDNLLNWSPQSTVVCPGAGFGLDLVSQLLDDTDKDIGYALNRPTYERVYSHEAILAGLVANGMSHAPGIVVPYNEGDDSEWYVEICNFSDTDSYTCTDTNSTSNPGIIFSMARNTPGYAWNLEGVPIKLALAALSVYCLLVILYALYTLATGQSSTVWRDVSEIVALAFNSTPPTKALRNCSAGISQLRTYRQLVLVKEMESTEKLELVFDDDRDKGPYRRLVKGHAY